MFHKEPSPMFHKEPSPMFQRTVPYVHVPLRVLRTSGRNWHRIGVDFWPEIGYYSATDSDGKVFSERE